jgi:hypothetical protein
LSLKWLRFDIVFPAHVLWNNPMKLKNLSNLTLFQACISR